MQRRSLLIAGASLALLGGCATQTAALRFGAVEGLPRCAELVDTPFFPQDQRYLCGPESLAAVLQATGLAVTPPDLVPQVYVPGRQGSLQAEMLAATRRQGAVAYVLPPRLEALLREVAAGTPVVILQNLGLQWAPTWHYAVVVGYDLDEGLVLLRSGPSGGRRWPCAPSSTPGPARTTGPSWRSRRAACRPPWAKPKPCARSSPSSGWPLPHSRCAPTRRR